MPLLLPLAHGRHVSINATRSSPRASSTSSSSTGPGSPSGFGILFFPLLLIEPLPRRADAWPWPVFAVVVVPAVGFAVYWGASLSGMLREGMQSWALALLAVIALQQAAAGFPWLRSVPIRVILSLRAFEVLALAVGATLGTRDFDTCSATASRSSTRSRWRRSCLLARHRRGGLA